MIAGASGSGLGYGKPPPSNQFKRGTSGNPRGRPRKRHKELPYEATLGRMVSVRENGRERRVTAAEAFILHLTKKGLEGCGASARASLASIEQARHSRSETEGDQLSVRLCWQTFGISCVIEDLGMGVHLNETSREKVRLMLKPWIVEAALTRMTAGQLSSQEQRVVLASTRTPEKVCWPDWLVAKP